MPVRFRSATARDLPALHSVIERAYRGETARLGWTHEADLLTGERIEFASLEAIVGDPDQTLLMMEEKGIPLGSVNIVRRGPALAYLGLLCVEPQRQSDGLGRRLIAAAEDHAKNVFGSQTMEMTVLEQRTELIAYYERRGYAVTGERRDFPIKLDPPYFMTVLAKSLV